MAFKKLAEEGIATREMLLLVDVCGMMAAILERDSLHFELYGSGLLSSIVPRISLSMFSA